VKSEKKRLTEEMLAGYLQHEARAHGCSPESLADGQTWRWVARAAAAACGYELAAEEEAPELSRVDPAVIQSLEEGGYIAAQEDRELARRARAAKRRLAEGGGPAIYALADVAAILDGAQPAGPPLPRDRIAEEQERSWRGDGGREGV
jgi:hypothetical protein